MSNVGETIVPMISFTDRFVLNSFFVASTALHGAGFYALYAWYGGGRPPVAGDSALEVTIFQQGLDHDAAANMAVQEKAQEPERPVQQIPVSEDALHVQKTEPVKPVETAPSPAAEEGLAGREPETLVSGDEWSEYMLLVRTRIKDATYYPRGVRRRGLKGAVMVSFRIGEDGFPYEIHTNNECRWPVFEETAEDIVRKAAPFPLPGNAALLKIPFEMRIIFQL